MPGDDVATSLARAVEDMAKAKYNLVRAQDHLRAREKALGLGGYWSDEELAWVTDQWSVVRLWCESTRKLPSPRDVGIWQNAAQEQADRTEFEVAALELLRGEGIRRVESLTRLGDLLRAVDLLNPVCRCGEYEDDCTC